jgi:hypothetical protein
MIALALVAAAIVTTVTVDLGPRVRERAERVLSEELARPTTLGGLSVRVFDGRLVARQVRIAGLDARAEPFLRASEIRVAIPLWSLLRREIRIASVEVIDWKARVEQYPGGKHNFPRIRSRSGGNGLFTTTFGYVHATRGLFSYTDYGTPWSVDLPDLDITVMRLAGLRGLTKSGRGVLRIQTYEPTWITLRTWFRIEGGLVHVERGEVDTYGSTTVARGVIDPSHWPEQRFETVSTVQMPAVREVFWARDTFSLTGEAHVTGSLHIY